MLSYYLINEASSLMIKKKKIGHINWDEHDKFKGINSTQQEKSTMNQQVNQ